ncbi:MAG: tetratricopeptide repeat protein [Kiritimatiellia bacterium]
MKIPLLLLLTLAATLRADTFRTAYNAATQAFKSEDYTRAATNYARALALATTPTETKLALRARADTHYRLQQYDLALRDYRATGQTDWAERCRIECANALLERIEKATKQDNLPLAESLSRDFLQAYLDTPSAPTVAWNLYALCHLQDKHDPAAAVLDLFLETWPQSPHRPEALLARAEWLQTKQRYQQAAADYLAIGGELNLRRAVDAYKRGRLWNEAAGLVAAHIPPDSQRAAGAWFEAGNLYLKANETNRANQAFARAVELAPGALVASEANYRLALAAEARGQVEQAIDLYGRVAGQASSLRAPEALWRSGGLLLGLAETNAALACYGRLGRLFPRSEYGARALLMEASLACDESKLAQFARGTRDRRLAAEAWMRLARLQLGRQDWDAAERTLLRIELLSDEPALRREALQSLARIATNRGNVELAEKYLKRLQPVGVKE